jgi:uncharacterized protein (TIGR03083 family)
MQQIVPIPTLHLFQVLDELLIDLLATLSPEDWNKPTLARLWTVKDIAAHLLDGNVRGIASLHSYEPPVSAQINSYQDLVNHLNQLNADWVNAMKRISPQLLIQQLVSTGEQYIQYLNTLEPFAPAKYSVAWAGEERSYNWFHIAREYTEKWHHQQQIREAVGKTTPLMTAKLFAPCIATFMCALPHAYHNTDATTGTVVSFIIEGAGGGQWQLRKTGEAWIFVKGEPADTTVEIPAEAAWKLFTKAIAPQTAFEVSAVKGHPNLANGIFNMVSVMA